MSTSSIFRFLDSMGASIDGASNVLGMVFWCTWRSIYGDSARTSSAGTVQRTFEMPRAANAPTKTVVLSVLDRFPNVFVLVRH